MVYQTEPEQCGGPGACSIWNAGDAKTKNASNSVALEQILSFPHHGTFFLPRMSDTVIVEREKTETEKFCFSLPLGKLVICGDSLSWL